MTSPSKPWIALAATSDLPIVSAPVEAAAEGVAEVRHVGLPYKPLSADEEAHYAAMLQGAGGILLRSGYVTASLLERLPDLQVVGVHGTGVDPVDVDACTARGVRVTNTPGANATAVTEITIGLMVALLRGIPGAAHKVVAERAWDSARHTGGELGGRTLGLVGLGQIGRRVGAVAAVLGMRVAAHDPGLDDGEVRARGAEPMAFDELLACADVLSLHAPSIAETRHMLDAVAMAKMKPGALVINCARGALIDETALAESLRSGHLGGAALDVLEGEPPDPSSPIFEAPNVLLTPHMAGSTYECLETIARMAGSDIVRVLSGDAPHHPVN